MPSIYRISLRDLPEYALILQLSRINSVRLCCYSPQIIPPLETFILVSLCILVMISESLPADSIPTRLDAFQSAQIPPGAPSLGDPTMYPFSRLPLASLPNATLSLAPSFSADLYGAMGASFAPNYQGHCAQGQGAVSVLESLTPNPTIHTQPSCFPEMYGAAGAYQGQDVVSVPQNLTPNSALPPSSLSPEMYYTGGTCFAQTYQGQCTVSPPASITPPMAPPASFTPPMSQNLTPNSTPTLPSLTPEMYSAGGASFVHTYQGQGTAPVPQNLTSNSTPTPPSLSPEMYSAGGASFTPTYQGQGTVSPQASFTPPTSQNLTPNSTPIPPSLSPKMYSAGASFVPNYQVQGTTFFPPESFIPPMFPVNNGSFQQPFYHSVGMLPSGTPTPFLPSAHSGAQAFPVPFQLPLPIQLPPATQQQTRYQIPQDGVAQGVAEMVPPQQPGSVDMVNYQANVAFQATLSPMQLPPATRQQAHYRVPQGVAEMVPRQQAGSVDGQNYQANVASQAAPSTPSSSSQRKRLENQGSVQRPAKLTTTKTTRKARKTVRFHDAYQCKLCPKVVFVHRKKYHDRLQHSPERGKYVCRICEVLQCPCTLSRKDALKRHVKGTHAEFKSLLENKAFGLLLPRRADSQEDLGELKGAMCLLAPRKMPKA
ncbi:hypothetical protein OG21DRAFT_321205 [Imleria badia]|nr:hypothetical protein OG21DRAFT_321205 [Imleria badia]